jgi:hypothetical protein
MTGRCGVSPAQAAGKRNGIAQNVRWEIGHSTVLIARKPNISESYVVSDAPIHSKWSMWAVSKATISMIAVGTENAYLFLHLMNRCTQDPSYHHVSGDNLLSPMNAVSSSMYMVELKKLWLCFPTTHASASELFTGHSQTISSLLFAVMLQPIWCRAIVDTDRFPSPTIHGHALLYHTKVDPNHVLQLFRREYDGRTNF